MKLCLQLLGLLCLYSQLLLADDTALKKYQEAETTNSSELRKRAFNEALTLYLRKEPEHPSEKLSFNIANTYFQLGEYGYAILYYYKALKEAPRDQQVLNNLEVALQKAGDLPKPSSFLQDYLLFFHFKLSHNEKEIVLLVLLFLAFILFSVHIWLPQELLKKLGIDILMVCIIHYISMIWAEYFSTPEAVIVRSSVLRVDAGEQYAPVLGKPSVSGTKVQVLSVEQQGEWIKVRLPSGETGYIAKEYVRLI